MEKRFVYADNAATTAVSPEVVEAMMPCFQEIYGNPSSLHAKGQEAKKMLNASREKIASLLGCTANEIYFTASGSEADNWAIKGAAHKMAAKGKHIISTKIEHHAVLHTLDTLKKEGFEVTLLDVNEEGIVDVQAVKEALRDDTILVAIMYANNEIGSIQPIREIGELLEQHTALFFTDAVQAVGAVPIDLSALKVDMLSFSGHKIHAPKGIGGLFIRKGVNIMNLVDGGGQERGKRGGTENLPYIVGLAKALEIAIEKLPDMSRVAKMRDRLLQEIEKIPHVKINGSRTQRLPGNVNASFAFVEGESLLLLLNFEGICASTGSACSSNSLEASHVLLATGLPIEMAHGSLRFTISHETTEEDIDYILEKLPQVVARLREMSPLC